MVGAYPFTLASFSNTIVSVSKDMRHMTHTFTLCDENWCRYSNQGPYEPDNTHLGRIVLPNAEILFGELASPPPVNQTVAALKQVCTVIV